MKRERQIDIQIQSLQRQIHRETDEERDTEREKETEKDTERDRESVRWCYWTRISSLDLIPRIKSKRFSST